MAKNAQLREALENINRLTDESRAALDAIVQADYGIDRDLYSAAFRKAIKDHEAFWRSTVPDLRDPMVVFDNSTDFIDPSDKNENNLPLLFVLAVKRRVIAAMDELSNDALLSIITARQNNGNLGQILNTEPCKTTLGVLDPSLGIHEDNDLYAGILDDIVRSAAKILYVRESEKIVNETFGGRLEHVAALLNRDNKAFCDAVVLPGEALPSIIFPSLDPSDAPAVKVSLGQHYVNAVINLGIDELDDLKKIAAASNTAELRARPIRGALNDASARLIINDSNAASFRLAAAGKALLLSLARCSDVAALDAIAAATTGADLSAVLEAHPALGLSGTANEAFRRTVADMNSIDAIQTAAQVYGKTLSADVAELAYFIGDEAWAPGISLGNPVVNPTALATHFRDKFLPALTDLSAVQAHFEIEGNQTLLREQCLIRVMKEAFKKMSADDLQRFNNVQSMSDLKQQTASLLGDPRAHDLLDKAPSLQRTLRALALCERLVLRAEGNSQLAGMIDLINKLDNQFFKNIPVTEQNYIRGRLTPALLRNFPVPDEAAAKKLMAVVNAEDEAAFKAALTDIDITAQDWVNSETMAAAQQAAVERALSLQMASSSNYDASYRPQLMKLLLSLPLADQRKRLANEQFMPAILNTRKRDELISILNIEPDKITDELAAEVNGIGNSQYIINAELARHLAGVTLDRTRIQNINAMLSALPPNAVDFSTAAYPDTINTIASLLDSNDRDRFRSSCGLDASGTIANSAVQAAMEQQREFNALLLARDTSRYTQEKTLFRDYVLTLRKGKAFDVKAEPDKNLLPELVSTGSYREFMKSAPVSGLEPVFQKSFKNTFTLERYNRLKPGLNKTRFTRPEIVEDALKDSKARLNKSKGPIEALSKLDGDIHNTLIQLSKTDALDWLSPEFQATAISDAKLLQHRFQGLPEACDEICRQFNARIDQLDQQLSALPKEGTIPRMLSEEQLAAIEEHRKELKATLGNLLNGAAMYEGLQLWFRGNPAAPVNTLENKGLVALLDEVVSGNTDIARFIGYHCTRKEYDLADKEKLLNRTLPRDRLAAGAMEVENDREEVEKDHYVVGTKAPAGKFYEYTIGKTEQTKGCFIEERLAGDLSTRMEDGIMEVIPKARYTVSVFPASDNGTEKARVEFAMALACQILRDRPANSNRPITLRRGDEAQLSYVWTALMILGKENPHLNINEKTIRIDSHEFNPKTQTGILGGNGFARNSIYNTAFKEHPGLSTMIGSFNGFSKKKFEGQSKERVETLKAAQRMGEFKKQLLKDPDETMKKIKDSNLSDENAPPSLKP
ncbi:hypothetical protein [Legionella sp. CNM-4043-24]|uniref:hypothetical protein n=1 Tax=Legionella sp. CNM-4043-24 TaxID=3421646 RepID=UPI00403A8826